MMYDVTYHDYATGTRSKPVEVVVRADSVPEAIDVVKAHSATAIVIKCDEQQ